MTPTQQPEEFRAVNQKFEEAAGRRDFSSLGEVYTKGARILPPGAEMIEGLEHIQAFWQQAVEAMGVKTVELSTVSLDVTGDAAVEIGRAELATEHPSSPTTVKYVVIWKKEDGAWKWDVDIWNAAAAA